MTLISRFTTFKDRKFIYLNISLLVMGLFVFEAPSSVEARRRVQSRSSRKGVSSRTTRTSSRSRRRRSARRRSGASVPYAARVRSYYRQRFNRPLPVSAFGQSRTHTRMRLDHSHAMDVPIRPSSREGRQLVAYLRKNNIPHRCFSRRRRGAATGPHIHIGRPSPRLYVRRNSPSRSRSLARASRRRGQNS
jgi:hypothetical protein